MIHYSTSYQNHKEGFKSAEAEVSREASLTKKILGPMLDPRVCTLFTDLQNRVIISSSLDENGNRIPITPELTQKLKTDIDSKIPGGAVSCPAPTFPADDAPPSAWLDFVQGLPKDIGSRTFFTAQYLLQQYELKAKEIDASLEGFEGAALCPPDVAESRRREAAAAAKPPPTTQACVLPEQLKPEEIFDRLQSLLIELQSTRNDSIQRAGLDPSLSLAPIMTKVLQLKTYLDDKKEKVQSGNITLPKVS